MTNFKFQQLINGEWVDAQNGGTWDLINPATEDVIQQLPFGDASDAEAAIDAAHTAFETWSQTTPYERAAVLMQTAQWILDHAEVLAPITTEESGKPLGESLAEWKSAANYFIWNAEECKRAYGRIIPARTSTRRIHVHQVPLGVVGTITAWNFPVYNVVRSWAAALAAGCTVAGRPSEYTPRSAMALAQALHESGAPKGVINLINGDPAGMAQVMLNDERCRKISFTGSTRVGKLLIEGAAKTVTRLGLELGGNAPFIVFPDVKDVSALAKNAVTWKLRNAGQVCVAPQRFYVHAQVVEEFTEQVVNLAKHITLGNGLEATTDLGPMINAKQRDRIEAMVTEAATSGVEVLAGGARPEQLDKGYFYQPTILSNLQPDTPIYNEELFAPVMPIIPFDDADEAIALANKSEYGLAAFVQTNDLNIAMRVSERLEYGMVCINDWLPATPEAPFGGVKQSGIGRECGIEGLEDYLETKTIFMGGVS